MEHRKRRSRRNRRTVAYSAVALVVALSAVVWLTTSSPRGTGETADSSQTVTLAASPTESQVSLSASPTTAPSASPSASPSPSHSTASAGAVAKSSSAAAGERVITVVNDWDETIWAATNPNAQYPISVTGWKLEPGQSVTFTVNEHWGGRIWGRTGCSFDSAGSGHCASGDCGGAFQCKGTGATPATLAELTLDAWDGMDFYDVSMVDGSNLPMYINTTHRTGTDPISADGCYKGQCTKAVVCPSGMQVKSGGQAVACETACAAFGGDAYCCTGAWAGRENCNPAKWPVDYAATVFKAAEPYAYSYAFDDSATMSCSGGCDYRVTFGITP